MSGPVTLRHRTTYHYDRPVQLGPQWIRLRPRPDPRIAPPAYRLVITPGPLSLHWLNDADANPVARIALPGPATRLTLDVTLGLDRTPRNPFDFVLDLTAIRPPIAYGAADAAVLAAYTGPDPPGPLLQALVAETEPGQDTVPLLLALAARVRDRTAYIVRPEHGVWSPERTLAEARGSCRDSAWLLVQLLRLHGFAARFVSGYLIQEDAAELHAWAEAYLPGAGWIGVDATSALLTAEDHVALAAAADPDGAAPLQGTVEPGPVRLEASITLEPLAA